MTDEGLMRRNQNAQSDDALPGFILLHPSAFILN